MIAAYSSAKSANRGNFVSGFMPITAQGEEITVYCSLKIILTWIQFMNPDLQNSALLNAQNPNNSQKARDVFSFCTAREFYC